MRVLKLILKNMLRHKLRTILTVLGIAIAVRLLLMRLTSRGRVDADSVYRAWALGSLVLVLGLTPETRLAVWVVAAVVTWIALVRHGASRPSASRLTGIAWGAQALVVVVSWLAESAILALLAVTS